MAPTQPSAKLRPWIHGIVDNFVGAHLIARSGLPHRNRLAVILLDSALETACRAYLRHSAKIKLAPEHKRREPLISTMKAHLTAVDPEVWENLDFYYEEVRNDVYHQTTIKTILDSDMLDYQEAVEFVIDRAFDIDIRKLTEKGLEELDGEAEEEDEGLLYLLPDLKDPVEILLVAVDEVEPAGVDELNALLRQQGVGKRFDSKEFQKYTSRGGTTRNWFFRDKERKCWTLSESGRRRLQQIGEEEE